MLIDYHVSNYCSIYEEQSFNMIAVNSYKEMENSHIINYKENIKILKSTAIYGPNASGKSTLLESLDTFRDIVLDSSSKYDINTLIPVTPFAFSSEAINLPTTFEINFVQDEIKYNFEIVVNKDRVLEEYLTAYPKGQPQLWYSRFYNEDTNVYEYQYGSNLKGPKKIWEKSTKKNSLFLSTAVNLNNDEDNQLIPIFNWFSEKLTPISLDGWSDRMTKDLCENEEYKEAIVKFLKLAGIDIIDIEYEAKNFDHIFPPIKDEKLRNSIKEVENLLLNDLGKDTLNILKKHINIKFVHSNGIKLDLREQSDGTKKLFAFASLWLGSLENGSILFCDELNQNLHPALVKMLVDLFNDNEYNRSNAQLIFTTHETSILNQEVLRRDQVWFCDRDENLSTKIYPLSDFKPRKEHENIEDLYLSGRYGAIPYFEKVDFKMNRKNNG